MLPGNSSSRLCFSENSVSQRTTSPVLTVCSLPSQTENRVLEGQSIPLLPGAPCAAGTGLGTLVACWLIDDMGQEEWAGREGD